MTQVLKNICRIEAIESHLLRSITIMPGEGAIMHYRRNFFVVPIVGLAQAEVVSRVENRTRLFTTTLSARLADHFDVRALHLSFLITCVDGSQYIIGSNEAPYPIVNTTDSMAGKPSDPSGCTLTVEYTDTIGLLTVLD